MDIYGHVQATINGHLAVIDGAVDTYGHGWATVNESMDTQVLSLIGLWTYMDMFGLPLMGLWTSMDMLGLPLMGPWTPGGCH